MLILLRSYLLLFLPPLDTAHDVDASHPLYKYRSSRGCMEHIALAMEMKSVRRGQAIIRRTRSEVKRNIEIHRDIVIDTYPEKIEPALHVIEQGEMEITEMKPTGFSQSYTLKSGEVFGAQTLHEKDAQLFTGMSYIWQAIAKHDAICWTLTKETLDLLAPKLAEVQSGEHFRVVRECLLFSELDDDAVRYIEMGCKVRYFMDGEAVVNQGDAVTDQSEVYLILSGYVQILITTETGVGRFFSETVGGAQGRLFLGHGDYICQTAVVNSNVTERTATIKARGPVACLSISKADLQSALAKSGKVVSDLTIRPYDDTWRTQVGGFDVTRCLQSACAQF